MRSASSLKLVVLFGLIAWGRAHAEALVPPAQYSVVKVTDGDTLEATDGTIHFKVRLAGIDTPELAQPYGKVARQELQNLVGGAKISLQYKGLDPFNRVLATVLANGQDVGLSLISKGLAYYYRPKCRDFTAAEGRFYTYDIRPYVSAEDRARAQKAGLFSTKESGDLPCNYRKQHRRSH